jgi:hypothetical protein
MSMSELPSFIIKRTEPDNHFEVHYRDRVEFWSIDMRKKLGESKVEVYEGKS